MRTSNARTSNTKSGHERTAGERRGNEADGHPSAVELLMNDHREVDALFERFESAEEGSPERLEIVHRISFALTLHARVEEEVVYPTARRVLGQRAKHLIDEAAVEHASLKHLLVELSTCDGRDYFFPAKVKVLSEYVKHHVDEEEGELFPALEASGVDLEELGALVAARKRALEEAYAPMGHADDGKDADSKRSEDER